MFKIENLSTFHSKLLIRSDYSKVATSRTRFGLAFSAPADIKLNGWKRVVGVEVIQTIRSRIALLIVVSGTFNIEQVFN